MSEYRERAIDEYGERCAKCGATDNIEIHHRDGDRTNNSVENLIPLCPSHHREAHSDEEEDADENGLVQITARIPTDDLAELEKMSEGTGKTRSGLIREAVSRYLSDKNADYDHVVEQLKDERDFLRGLVTKLTD